MITRIFLDIDGVLANWVMGVCQLYRLHISDAYDRWPDGEYDICRALGWDTDDMWRRIHDQGAAFWERLEPYSWKRELVDMCESYAPVTLLSSPSRDPSCCAGKHAWIRKHLPDYERRFLLGADKAACARPGAVLIDDSDHNCKAFFEQDGGAITFPRHWNIMRAEQADPLFHVGVCLKAVSR
jgi:hypothetical protein